MKKKFSHIDEQGNASMVDVSDKLVTVREARASCLVQLPAELKALIEGEDLPSKKGPVFQTAILAGVMAAKKTAELIPLCHPLPLTDCKVYIELDSDRDVRITTSVKTSAQTGVEMEALTAASVAALTIYDMCKAVSHDIKICQLQLESKSGGKHAFNRS